MFKPYSLSGISDGENLQNLKQSAMCPWRAAVKKVAKGRFWKYHGMVTDCTAIIRRLSARNEIARWMGLGA